METMPLGRCLNTAHALVAREVGREHASWWLSASAAEIARRAAEVSGEPPPMDGEMWGAGPRARAGAEAMMALASEIREGRG